jgi:hypothetical protein
MTARTLAAFAASPPDWLDESDLGESDYLALPGAQAHAGWNLETWNRDFGVPISLRGEEEDNYRFARARVNQMGRLILDRGGEPSRTLVVNDYASAADFDGTVLPRPRPGISVWRLRGDPRLRSLADGLYHDGWAAAVLRYRVWGRGGPGAYRLRLSLPAGRSTRKVELRVQGGESKTVVLEAGDDVGVELSANSASRPGPLEIRTNHGDFEGRGGPAPRLVAVRVSGLHYAAL